MASDSNSLSAQAAAVRQIIDRKKQAGRPVPVALQEAGDTLHKLDELAAGLCRRIHSENEENLSDDLAEQMLTILRLPVVKA